MLLKQDPAGLHNGPLDTGRCDSVERRKQSGELAAPPEG